MERFILHVDFPGNVSLMLQTLSAGGPGHISSSEAFSSGICGFETTKVPSLCSPLPAWTGGSKTQQGLFLRTSGRRDSMEEPVTEAPVTRDSS